MAQTIEHAQLYAQAQRRVAELEALARISEAVSESLYLEESLEAIVKTTMDAVSATGAALVLEDGRIAWPEGRAGAHAVRTPLRWRGRQIGELVADRDAPFSDDDRALLEAIAHHAAVALEHGRAVMRGVLAQEIHHRVKNNLQTVASLLRLQSRAEGVDPREALEHSVNRILAIAAVHEVLTEQREEDVDLSELIDRLRAMLVQGLGAGRDVTAELETVSLAGTRATALALVFSELLQNALEHGAGDVRIELARRDGDVVLAIADDGPGPADAALGNGSLDRACARPRRAPGDVRPAQRRRHARGGGVPGMTRTREVAIFVRRGDEFLVLHRSPENDAYWHVVAGGVEDGESFAAAAARELAEETGLVVELLRPRAAVPLRRGRRGLLPRRRAGRLGARARLGARRLPLVLRRRRRRDAPLAGAGGRAARPRLMEPAPPYRGEGPPALWHVSEDDSIRRFEPRDGKVWAIDTRHLPLYWFPRDCPRATFWACASTAEDDVVRFLGGDRDRRVHVVEPAWLERDAVGAGRRLPAARGAVRALGPVLDREPGRRAARGGRARRPRRTPRGGRHRAARGRRTARALGAT